MGISVSIYRSQYDSDLNVFKGYKRVCVTNVEGPFEPNENTPAARLEKLHGHYVLVPDDSGFDGVQMFGGTFASTSDSRWFQATGQQAVAIHDRRESYKEYAEYSR